MGRYFDTTATLATIATEKADLSQESQLSRGAEVCETNDESSIDLRDAFEERAAILEYDGGMSRADSERRAAAETGYRFRTDRFGESAS